jgi:hypothetical protein
VKRTCVRRRVTSFSTRCAPDSSNAWPITPIGMRSGCDPATVLPHGAGIAG